MRRFAKATRQPGKMNKAEAAYASVLEARRLAGDIVWFAYEAITFKLANDTRYTPDFVVQAADDTLEFHEVKGFMREDAWAKLKIAAAMFPFRFHLVKAVPKKDGGGWSIQEVSP